MAEVRVMEDIAKETLDILEYFDSDFMSKIPENFMEKLKAMAALSTITVYVDKTKRLEEQDISEDCKDMIALIYYSYIASEEEKEQISKKWNENEKEYQKNIREQYNPDNLFKNKAQNNEHVEENVQLLQYKESLWKKILNKIRRLFRI